MPEHQYFLTSFSVIGNAKYLIISKTIFQSLAIVRDLSYTLYNTKCQLPCGFAMYLLEGRCHTGDILPWIYWQTWVVEEEKAL